MKTKAHYKYLARLSVPDNLQYKIDINWNRKPLSEKELAELGKHIKATNKQG